MQRNNNFRNNSHVRQQERQYDNHENSGRYDNNELKKDLIGYIYDTIDVARFNYEVLNNETQLSKFLSSTYYIAPNFCGKNCFLVFMKLKSKFYSFLVDRFPLKYSYDKINFDDVYIQQCNVDIDINFYKGTIFDGTYIKKGNNHEFIITDVYYFNGTDFTDDELKHKLFEVQMCLDNINSGTRYKHEKNSSRTNLDVKVNKISDLLSIRKLANETSDNTFNTYATRGICFYPQKSGTRLVHLNSQERINNNDNNTRIMNSTKDMTKSQSIVKKIYVAKNDEPIYAILEMKATKIADNYKLYAVEQIVENNVPRLRKYPMDIACIPSIEKSKWCKDIVTESQKGSVLVKCIWRDNRRKWEPLEVKDNVKIPSLIDDIRGKLIEMEKSDSESGEE